MRNGRSMGNLLERLYDYWQAGPNINENLNHRQFNEVTLLHNFNRLNSM